MTTPFSPDISEWKKDPLCFSFNVFSTKVIIGDSIFKPTTGDGAAILRGHPSHSKVSLAVWSAKACNTFISQLFFKTLSISRAPRIEPATFRSVVKRSTDWANPSFFVCLCLMSVFQLAVLPERNITRRRFLRSMSKRVRFRRVRSLHRH